MTVIMIELFDLINMDSVSGGGLIVEDYRKLHSKQKVMNV